MRRVRAWLGFWVLVLMLAAAGWPRGLAQAAKIDYAKYEKAITRDAIEQMVKRFAGLGSRVTGYEGNTRAAEIIQEELRSCGPALRRLTVETFSVAVPVDKGATLRIPSLKRTFTLYCMWPNLTRPPSLPRAGVSGHLVYGGRGAYADFNGREIEGAVVLMEFDSRDNMVNARLLGARAIVFIEPDRATRDEAEQKFLSSPVNIPRYWLKRQDADALLAGLQVRKEDIGRLADDQGAAAAPIQAELKARMDWEEIQGKNIHARIPGTMAEEIEARLGPLERRVAALKETGGDGYEAAAEQAAEAKAELEEWQRPVIIQAYYDSMSVVPALSPGAEQSSGVVVLLQLAKLFARERPKHPVIFLATSAHCEMLTGMAAFMYAHCYPAKEKDAMSLERFKNLFREELNPKLVIGLDLSSHGTGLGVFGTGHLMTRAQWGRGQEKAFFTPFGKLLTRYGRQIAVQRDLERAAGRLELSEPEVALAQAMLVERERFELKGKGEGMKVGGRQVPPALVNRILSALTRAEVLHPTFVPAKVDLAGVDLQELALSRPVQLSGHEQGARPEAALLAGMEEFLVSSMYGWRGQMTLDYEPRMLQNGITPIRAVVWQSLLPSEMALDAEYGAGMGLANISLATINDARLQVDTPHDTPEHMDFDNLARDARFLACLFADALNETDEYPSPKAKVRNSVRSFRGRIVEFRVGRSILADFPVPGVVVSARDPTPTLMKVWNTYKTLTGVRTGHVAITDAKGYYDFPYVFARRLQIEPYRYDPDTARVVCAADRGPDGEGRYTLTVPVDVTQKKWTNVTFRCQGLDLYQIDDPRYLRYLDAIDVLGPRNFSPTRYGYSEISGRGEVVFFEPHERVKIIMGSGIFGKQYLLTNVDLDQVKKGVKQAEEGRGFKAAPPGDDPMIVRSAEQVVRDMIALNGTRIRGWLRQYGIRNQRLEGLHKNSQAAYKAATEARAAYKYDEYVKYIRAARGYAARAYPDVKGTANDTVKGIVFYFALLLPFSFFSERLFFAFADIRKRIAGFAGIFVVVFLILRMVHPAFKISHAPWIIFVAFVLLVMGSFVIVLVVRRFNEQVAEMRRAAAEVHHADVGRLSASLAAFNLGVSNMRRRKMRTFLTTVTLILLTFTVLSFTSVRTFTRFNEISVDAKATYPGALLRDRNWNPMEDIAERYIESAFQYVDLKPIVEQVTEEFGADAGREAAKAKTTTLAAALRSWKVAFRKEDELHLRVANPDTGRSGYAKGAVGITALESQATGIDKALVAGEWIEPGVDDFCYLPVRMAERLGIRAEDFAPGKKLPRVQVCGAMVTVRGLLDGAMMNELTDLDGAAISPVDTSDIQSRTGFGQAETVATVRDNPTEIVQFKHMDMGTVILVPHPVVIAVGGRLSSVAVRKPDDWTQELFIAHIKRFMDRVGMTLFVSNLAGPKGSERGVTAYSSMGLTSFKGLGSLFVPILIAALIVLNTMMGSVYERFREIGIYSSVGLAPLHIASLFIAESCMYAVLGAIIGYLIGQVVGTGLAHYEVLKGVTLNYSSMSTVFSTMIVMSVVVLSTVYPAKVASDMAVPDVTRRWKFPEPRGDEWVFDFPFTVASAGVLGLYTFLQNYFEGYTEESVGSFYTDRVSFESMEGEYGSGYLLKMMVWIAPFDMGVSQEVEMRAIETEDAGIARIQVYIHRETGEVSAWRRLNKGFLTEIRKQFLIWRTVPEDVKHRYAQEGGEMLAQLTAAAGARTD